MKAKKLMSRWVASLRLQLNPLVNFGFAQVTELVPFFKALGISHIYLSPAMECAENSDHGYDVLNPNKISRQRGGRRAYLRMCRVLKQNGISVIWDATHHMLASDKNPYWNNQVPGFPRQRVFDIDPVTGMNRGFMDFLHLASVKEEDDAVFDETNRLLISLCKRGVVQGIRIDAAEYLLDMDGYTDRLFGATGTPIWLEVINGPDDELPAHTVGSVGMDEMTSIQGAFLSPAGQDDLVSFWHELSGRSELHDEVARAASREFARTAFAPQIDRLHREAIATIGDVSREDLVTAILSFARRTHLDLKRGIVSASDREVIEAATLTPALRQVFLLEKRGCDEFLRHFEHLVVCLQAKGGIQTIFRYLANIGMNDSGCHPDRGAITSAELHRRHELRAARMPHSLNTRSTHDTHMSGDVRSRFGALTYFTSQWRALVAQWFEVNEVLHSGQVHKEDQYFLYQFFTCVGFIDPSRFEEGQGTTRLQHWLREAGLRSSWANPNTAYEEAVKAFVQKLRKHEPFLKTYEPFHASVATLAAAQTLGQLVIQHTSPGMGDIYQGDLMWLFLINDPDNRRPVDWKVVTEALACFEQGVLPTFETAKLFVVWQVLKLRQRYADAFAGDSYTPVDGGSDVFAYQRGDSVQVHVPLRPGAKVTGPGEGWRNVLKDLDGLDGLGESFSLGVFERVS